MRGRVLLYREALSPAPPHEETWVGERWGRPLLREAPPPRPLSRRVAGNKLGCSCKLVRPCWVRLLSDKLGRRGLTQVQQSPPTSQAEPPMQKRTTPNASRSSGERGLGGEALLSEKRPLPPVPFSSHVSWGGSAREGASLQRSPLPRKTHYSYFPTQKFEKTSSRMRSSTSSPVISPRAAIA